MRMSRTLNILDSNGKRFITCSKCDKNIASADESWKQKAVRQDQVMNSFGEPFSAGDEVIIRSFACPACGTLLDTEIAMKDDPYLEDRIFD